MLTGCTKAPAPAPAAADVAGTWRATLALPGGELPFGLEIGRNAQGALTGYLRNGEERVEVTAVTQEGASLSMRMPGFQNTLTATVRGDDLRGEVVLVRLHGKQQRIPLAARRHATHRFFRSPMLDGANVAGRWAVVFTTAEGKSSPAVGEFQQDGAIVTGTFLTPTGDHRYLAGEMRGQELYLSTFDGAHAYLYRAQFKGHDRFAGQFWSGLSSVESFVAVRDANATIDSASLATQLRAPDAAFDFQFPDLDGRLVSLADARFRGKVVVVTLAGSWCPNCHDEAAYLAPLYRQWRDRGFEVVSLMFERFGDFERAAAATRVFRQELGIEYETLIAGISDKADAGTRLPQLNGVFAFPTTIFIGRDRRVRHLHTGFAGPATGAHHAALKRDFETRIEQLLAEPGR